MRNFVVLLLVVVAGLASSCSKDEHGTAQMVVLLTDAPASFDKVNVEVTGVDIHTSQFGWTSVDVADSIYDLLTLQDSANAVLDTITIATGKITQIRLILGSQNSVSVSGTVHPLKLSSQDETGLKIQVHQTINAGQAYTLLLDFDAGKSVIQEGNGSYRLKPVISASFF